MSIKLPVKLRLDLILTLAKQSVVLNKRAFDLQDVLLDFGKVLPNRLRLG